MIWIYIEKAGIKFPSEFLVYWDFDSENIDYFKGEIFELNPVKSLKDFKFPNDPIMQQVHIARKIIAKKAEKKGLTYLEYIKKISESFKVVHNG